MITFLVLSIWFLIGFIPISLYFYYFYEEITVGVLFLGILCGICGVIGGIAGILFILIGILEKYGDKVLIRKNKKITLRK